MQVATAQGQLRRGRCRANLLSPREGHRALDGRVGPNGSEIQKRRGFHNLVQGDLFKSAVDADMNLSNLLIKGGQTL